MKMVHEIETRSNVRDALKAALGQLRAAGVPSHTLAAELLLMRVLGRDRPWLYTHPEELLAPEQQAQFAEMVARRCAGEPTQYLTGKQEFWGREFEVGPGVLIPRPETEHVVEVALEKLGPPSEGEFFYIADIGTGSGCLAITLALALPHSRVLATDISENALVYARRNGERHGVSSRVNFECVSLLGIAAGSPSAPAPASLQLVVSNPPYVARHDAAALPREIRDHEPAEALFGGEQGHEFYEPLINEARNALAPGGVLVLELGYNSLPRVRSLLDSPHGWSEVGVTNDLAGIPRVISARKSPHP